MTKKIVGQYPLLMQPHWTQIPVTKILFVVFVGIEYTEFREDVFFFQLLLSNCSQTLEELEITELTGIQILLYKNEPRGTFINCVTQKLILRIAVSDSICLINLNLCVPTWFAHGAK